MKFLCVCVYALGRTLHIEYAEQYYLGRNMDLIKNMHTSFIIVTFIVLEHI